MKIIIAKAKLNKQKFTLVAAYEPKLHRSAWCHVIETEGSRILRPLPGKTVEMATPPKYQTLKRVLWSLSWVPVAITINQTMVQLSWVQGRSMQPALNPDSSLGKRDLVVVKKWSQDYKPGDVLLIRSPLDPERILIKRVKGVSGSIVHPRPTSEYPKDQLRVPINHLWVEGDNIHSVDSNQFGPISKGLVIGKASYILLPLARSGPISTTGGRADAAA